MRNLTVIICVFFMALASCDLRSETAKREMEKYESKPTPPIVATPTSTPVDPADIVEVDTTLDGETIFVEGRGEKKNASCTKFNRLMINGNHNVIIVKGVCRQIMVNGDTNEISADGALEFVLNGSDNNVRYFYYPNGKLPTKVENQEGNTIEKVSAKAGTSSKSGNKIVK